MYIERAIGLLQTTRRLPPRDLRMQAVYQADGSAVHVSFPDGTKEKVQAQPDRSSAIN